MYITAMDSKGSTAVIEYFFQHGFGDVDAEKSYMLMHMNPPWLPEEEDWNSLGNGCSFFCFRRDLPNAVEEV